MSKISMVKPPLKRSYVNNPEKNPFRAIWDSDKFANPAKHHLADFPLIVHVEPTSHCNLHCTFCANQILERGKGFMDFELYKQVVNETAQNNKAIKFGGWGESFMHPNIYEMFAYAKEKGLIIHVTTNGVLVDPHRLQDIDSINFSFQGTTKEEYKKIRNNDFYDLIAGKIETLLRLSKRPAVGITTTVLDETEEQIADFISKWIDKVEQVSWGYTYYGHLEKEWVQQFKKRETWGGRQEPCTRILVELTIDWDGYVPLCCADYDCKMVLGRLNDSTIEELWLCDKMQTCRKFAVYGQKDKISVCRTCSDRW